MPTLDEPLQGHSAESESELITMGASTSRGRLRDSDGPEASPAGLREMRPKAEAARARTRSLQCSDPHVPSSYSHKAQVPCSYVQRRTVRFAERQVGPALVDCCGKNEREDGSVAPAHSERIATAAI